MIRSISLLAWLLLPFVSSAQPLGQRIYNTWAIDSLSNYNLGNVEHVDTRDGGMVVYAQDGGGWDFLFRLDAGGKKQWSVRFDEKPGVMIYDMVELPDESIVLTGYIDAGLDNADILLVRISKNGKLIWDIAGNRRYGDVATCITYKSGKIYIAGNSGSFTAPPNEIFLAIFDTSGSLLKFDTRFQTWNDEIMDIAVADDGWIYICGTGTGQPLLIAANPAGNITYLHHIEGLKDGTAWSVEADGHNAWISGDFYENDTGYMFTMPVSPIPMVDKTIYTYGIKGTVIKAYGATLFSRYRHYISGYLSLPGGESGAFIAETRTDGGLIWAKRYGSKNHQYLMNIGITSGPTLSASGSTLHSLHAYDVYIVRATTEGISSCDEWNLEFSYSERIVKTPDYHPGFITPRIDIKDAGIDYAPFRMGLVHECKNGPPIAGFRAPANICVGSYVAYTDTSRNANTIKWYFEGAEVTSFTGSAPPAIRYPNVGTFAVKQYVSNPEGEDSMIRYIQVHPGIVADAGKDTFTCQGQVVRLTASGGNRYHWKHDGNYKDPFLPYRDVQPDSSQYFYVTVLDSNGCMAADSVFVKVIPKPVTIKMDTVLCLEKILKLDAGNPGFSYQWNNGATSRNMTVNAPGTYEVEISNECFTEKSVYKVGYKDCRLSWHMPESFSPNHDSLNDFFLPIGENIRDIQLQVYNRWGERVYEGKGKTARWDGRFKGSSCPIGIYLYRITVRGDDYQVQHKTGTLMLVR